ncbi:hypothetical protein HT031_004626 [Scenedesmus sp. PABB004]|nr:hypothetical protein HT031_004626 [Scenedesmus sp. PABB004]
MAGGAAAAPAARRRRPRLLRLCLTAIAAAAAAAADTQPQQQVASPGGPGQQLPVGPAGADAVAAAAAAVRAQLSRALLQAPSSPRFQKPYNVTCSGVADPADYSGYQVALWRAIASDLGWADTDWAFTCVDWTPMIDDLVSPDGLCSFAAAGVEVSVPNILLGLKFSWPIYKSGFHVLISSTVQQGGTWAFAEAFHWSVWVVLGATAVVVSLFISAAELLTHGTAANGRGLRGWSWYAMGKMVQVNTHVGDPQTWASRLLVLGYAFLALIMVHLFTGQRGRAAQHSTAPAPAPHAARHALTARRGRRRGRCRAATTASKLTMQRLANDITSKADLPGKAVETWDPYVPLLRKYSIDADGLPWDSDADTAVMLDNLRKHRHQARAGARAGGPRQGGRGGSAARAGTTGPGPARPVWTCERAARPPTAPRGPSPPPPPAQALILDTPVVAYMAARAPGCDLYAVGDPFETFNLAIAFPPDVPSALAANISASIVRLQTTSALLDRLENEHVKAAADPSATCAAVATDAGVGHAPQAQIRMDQVAGLWYILFITLGLAVALAGVDAARSRARRTRRRTTRRVATLAAAAVAAAAMGLDGARGGGACAVAAAAAAAAAEDGDGQCVAEVAAAAQRGGGGARQPAALRAAARGGAEVPGQVPDE